MSPRSPHVLQRRAVAMPSHQSVQSPAESCRQTVVHSIICGMLPLDISPRPASPPVHRPPRRPDRRPVFTTKCGRPRGHGSPFMTGPVHPCL